MALAVALEAAAEAAGQCSNSYTKLHMSGVSIIYTSMQGSVTSRNLSHKCKTSCYPESEIFFFYMNLTIYHRVSHGRTAD